MAIKVVQIAYLGEGEATEYLDDQGRVWYDGGKSEQYTDENGVLKGKWVVEWKQLELPNEPEVDF